MYLDVNKLPKKFNEFNYFEKNENGTGCTLYSYSTKSNMIIVCKLDDFEIEHSFCVDNKALEMLKVLNPINNVNIKNNSFIVESKKGKYKSKLIETNSFNKPIMEFDDQFKADLNRLKIANRFCSTNERKPILTGVNVSSNGDINATDSFTAYRYVNKNNVDKNCNTITIPKDFVDFISKNVDTNEEIVINFNNNTCMIEVGNIMYINKLLGGTYPDLSRIFNSKENAKTICFDKESVKEKVEIAKNIGTNKDMPIYITFEKDNFIANGENKFASELIDNMKNGVDYNFTISLNYFNEVLSHLKNEKIVLGYTESVRPIFVEENGNEFLILPVKREQ